MSSRWAITSQSKVPFLIGSSNKPSIGHLKNSRFISVNHHLTVCFSSSVMLSTLTIESVEWWSDQYIFHPFQSYAIGLLLFFHYLIFFYGLCLPHDGTNSSLYKLCFRHCYCSRASSYFWYPDSHHPQIGDWLNYDPDFDKLTEDVRLTPLPAFAKYCLTSLIMPQRMSMLPWMIWSIVSYRYQEFIFS